jgi:hypothetical protein
MDKSVIAEMARSTLRRRSEELESRLNADAELKRCRESFPYFLFRHCRTLDEHDPTQFAKAFPRHPYILTLSKVLQSERRIAVEKSRQMMISWVVCAFVLWVAMFQPNVLFFVQSKKEEDAADRLDRIYKIYFRLPAFMRERFPLNLNSGRPGTQLYTDLYLTWRGEDRAFFGFDDSSMAPGSEFADLVKNNSVRSRIWAIPQGADVVRQYTASGLFSDEDAFQSLAGEAYGAYMPTMSKDSWVIKVSTPNPGHFESVARDREVR